MPSLSSRIRILILQTSPKLKTNKKRQTLIGAKLSKNKNRQIYIKTIRQTNKQTVRRTDNKRKSLQYNTTTILSIRNNIWGKTLKVKVMLKAIANIWNLQNLSCWSILLGYRQKRGHSWVSDLFSKWVYKGAFRLKSENLTFLLLPKYNVIYKKKVNETGREVLDQQ